MPPYQKMHEAAEVCEAFLTRAGLTPLTVETRLQIQHFDTRDDLMAMLRSVNRIARRVASAEGEGKEMEFMEYFTDALMHLQGREDEPRLE